MFRFVHAADIHLDAPMTGLATLDATVAERIRTAAREAFVALVDRTLEEEAAFLILAGDVFDDGGHDMRTALFFARQMGRLAAAGIPVFLLHGNHDAGSGITRHLPLPDNVRVFPAGHAATFRLGTPPVALHGRSYPRREVREDLAAGYPDPVAGAFNIGVLHTALDGREGHANYAPCTLATLLAKGYDYWALGHVHTHEVVHRHPPVVFPGKLQGRHIRETGAGGAVLVEVADGRVREMTFLPLDVVRWSRIAVDVTGLETLDRVEDGIRDAVTAALERESDGRPLVCRIVLEGRTSLHDPLAVERPRLLDRLRTAMIAAGGEGAWIERIELRTAPPVTTRPPSGMLDPLTDGLRELATDPIVAAGILEDLRTFLQRLPVEVRASADDPVLAALLAREPDPMPLLEEARREIVGRIARNATGGDHR